LWSYGNETTQINAQTYEEVWALVERLLARLELHLRAEPGQTGPLVSPEVRAMLDKLTSKGGSLTYRDLCRCYRKMSRARLDPLVAEARDAGLVRVEGQTIALVEPACQRGGYVNGVGGVRSEKNVLRSEHPAQTPTEERQDAAK